MEINVERLCQVIELGLRDSGSSMVNDYTPLDSLFKEKQNETGSDH